MEPFRRLVIREILSRVHEYHVDNWDYVRFGPNPVAHVAGRFLFNIERSTDFFVDVLTHLPD